ncbi:MAG: AI-2E family transporter [Ktedonobacterales bacterium]
MFPDLFQRYRMLRVLLTLVTLIVAIYAFELLWGALQLFGDIILLFFLAWIVSFILEPVSVFLQQRGVKRPLAVTLIYLALAVVISGLIVLTIPTIGDEAQRVAQEITLAFAPTNINALNQQLLVTLKHLGFSDHDARNFVSQLSSQIPGFVSSVANQAINTTTSLVTSVLVILFDTFLVIILSFYMMLDGERLVERMVVRLPPVWIEDVSLFQKNVDQIFGGFFRAQLIIGAVYGVITWLALLALGQANGLLVALLAGLFMLLPFIGPFLAVVPPIMLVLLQTPPNQVILKLIILGVTLFLGQQLVFQIIAPRVMGSSIGMHPLLLFAALLIGAKEGGVWGAFFAAPILAVAIAMLQVFYDRFAATSPLFKPVQRAAASAELANAAETEHKGDGASDSPDGRTFASDESTGKAAPIRGQVISLAQRLRLIAPTRSRLSTDELLASENDPDDPGEQDDAAKLSERTVETASKAGATTAPRPDES